MSILSSSGDPASCGGNSLHSDVVKNARHARTINLFFTVQAPDFDDHESQERNLKLVAEATKI